jgi:5-methylcytosine-specific restriction endonuclease McrA
MKYEARQRGYKVLAKRRPDEVLPHTGPEKERRGFTCQDGVRRLVKMTSLRYRTFKKNLRCACCGIEGTIFLLELPSNGGKICIPHFNLYAEREGELVQMTKDHKQPKSKGGADHIDNMQTMCCTCNELKGNQHRKGGNSKVLKGLREIQDGVQTVYTVSTPTGFAVDYFATSKKGIVELVDRFIKSEYRWEESYQISVSLHLDEIYVENPIGEALTFYINTIRRV